MGKSFHRRFNIRIGEQEAKCRFVNRTLSLLQRYEDRYDRTGEQRNRILSAIGKPAASYSEPWDKFITDFYTALEALEALYSSSRESEQQWIGKEIQNIVDRCEVDLGVRWHDGYFARAGAAELDDALVNEPLKWLEAEEYRAVGDPFEKGLKHLMAAMRRPEFLCDVITDMYEAIEGLAKVVTGRDDDLSANRERFVKELSLSSGLSNLLKQYISYANEFRHAAKAGEPRKLPKEYEVEAFVYFTGTVIRLAVRARDRVRGK